MSTAKKIEAWRAELIAKVFLLSNGYSVLPVEGDKSYDFIAQNDNAGHQKLAIEVLPTRYSKQEIVKKFSVLRDSIVPNGIPVVLLFINSDKENGYFEVIGKKSRTGLFPLTKDVFETQIAESLN